MTKSALTIVKLGGNILEDPAARAAALTGFAALHGARVLVHGGGRTATAMAERLGIVPQLIDGRRVTDRPTLDVVTMVYGGLVNRTVVAELQGRGCNACGVTGADFDLIRARRRPVGEIDYGHVGDIVTVNVDAVRALLDVHSVPVVAPLTHDGEGALLNTNADSIASSIASALASALPVQLLFCFDSGGVRDREGRILPVISLPLAEQLTADGVIRDGMLPKLHSAFEAKNAGVERVILCAVEHIAAAAEGGTGPWTEVRT